MVALFLGFLLLLLEGFFDFCWFFFLMAESARRTPRLWLSTEAADEMRVHKLCLVYEVLTSR